MRPTFIRTALVTFRWSGGPKISRSDRVRLSSTTIGSSPSLEDRKRLDVAIVGLPNAGKSQLLNVLTQSTVAAVSRKRHTTRDGILGARTVDDTQLYFVDTPGFLRQSQAKKEGLNRDLVVTASSEMENVDFSLLVVDAARRMTDDYEETLVALMLAALKSQGRLEFDVHSAEEVQSIRTPKGGTNPAKFAVVLNKVDLVHPKSNLMDLAVNIGTLAEQCIKFDAKESGKEELFLDSAYLQESLPMFFYISALKQRGVQDLLEFLLERATPSTSWEVEAGEATPMTMKERIEEVIREKIYRCLHKEVPHSIRQENRVLQQGKDEDGNIVLVIHQDLIVRSKSHQELVHGGGGRTLERIRETAARGLEKIFFCNVVLHLHVKLPRSKNQRWSI